MCVVVEVQGHPIAHVSTFFGLQRTVAWSAGIPYGKFCLKAARFVLWPWGIMAERDIMVEDMDKNMDMHLVEEREVSMWWSEAPVHPPSPLPHPPPHPFL